MAITWRKLAFEDDVITKAFMAAKGDLISASTDDTPLILTVGANGKYLKADSGEATGLIWDTPSGIVPATHKDSHDPEDGSDALDTAGPSALLEVQVQATGTSHSLARADHAHAIVHDITDNSLVTIDGTVNAPADDDIAVFTADGLEGQTPAQVAATMALDDIGVPDAAVDFDLQQATDLVVMTVDNEAALPAANVAVGQLCWATGELTLHVCTASV